MKPSDKIEEIFKKLCEERGLKAVSPAASPIVTMAIIDYLDEEYEKNNQVNTKKE